jgi:RNA polymerase sigma-70 factor (ECF subfamily)
METLVRKFAASMFGRYRRELHRYLMRRLRQPQDVNDLAQEVYLRLLRLDDEKVVHKPLAYLYGIASHVLCDFRIEVEHESQWFKRDQRGELIDADGNVLKGWDEHPSQVVPDDIADRLNLQQQIDRAVAQLPPTHAAVLLAHKRDGMSYEEVAEKLGLSIHTVEKYVTQAKSRIRVMTWDR